MNECEPCEWCDREQEWERIHEAEARQEPIHSEKGTDHAE